jgi:hypothetical protein
VSRQSQEEADGVTPVGFFSEAHLVKAEEQQAAF